MESPTPPAASPRLLQEVADTAERARLGGPFYLIGWAVVWLASPTAQAFPRLALGLGALFVLGLLVRLRLARPIEPSQRAALQRRAQVWLVVGATTALWGALAAWILGRPGEHGAHLVVLICTVAFATAIAHSFCMRQAQALGILALVYLPAFGALLVERSQAAATAAIGVYLVYLVLVLRRSHREYEQRLDLEDHLRTQRDRFEAMSRHDGLTGLANRRRFEAALAERVANAAAHLDPFALLLLDLDHFKAINDRHGHAAGDACLKEFALRLQHAFGGAGELVARLGGEEFAVLIEGADEDAAAQRGDAFRQQTAGSPLVLPDVAIGLTVSIGVGAFGPRHRGDGERFFTEVDRALYRAKAEGRNALRRVDAGAG